MSDYESYQEALEAAREEITRIYATSPETYPPEDVLWERIAERARELFGAFEFEPEGGWRVEHRHVRVLVGPDGKEHFDGDLLSVAQIAEIRGVTRARVHQWGERIGLLQVGTFGCSSVSDVLGFKPRPTGRPRA